MRRHLSAGLPAAIMLLTGGLALGQEQKVFFGILHSHTSYSDGSGTPQQAYRQARDMAGCDFFAITEHNHKGAEKGAKDRADGRLIGKDHSLYEGPDKGALIPTAERLTEPGRFVAMYGQEFSTIPSGNHVNVFDVPKVIDVKSGEFGLLIAWLSKHRDTTGEIAIIQFNHPSQYEDENPDEPNEYGADDFESRDEWVREMGKCACTIEILNGPAMSKKNGQRPKEVMEKDYLEYLALGFHLAPSAGQDNHYATWGTLTDARTGVVADELTKTKLMAAIRARHVYATEDRNLKVLFKINGHLCGDRVSPTPPPRTPLRIEYRIKDGDEPGAEYEIEVFGGRISGPPATVMHGFAAHGNTPNAQWEQNTELTYTGKADYFFFKVTQKNATGRPDRAWTGPVWFETGQSSLAAAVAETDTSQAVASRNSTIYHVSKECCAARNIRPENLLTGEEAIKGRRLHAGCPIR